MKLTEEQSEQIKAQLLKQVGKFPEDKQESLREKILSMSKKDLEEFVKQNQMLSQKEKQHCIFCSIISQKIPSFKIDEDEKNIAVLEIAPLTKAHTLVIPKKHSESEANKDYCINFAKKVSEKISKKFEPKQIKLNQTNISRHSLIEIIPLYKEEDAKKTERKKASEEELKKLQEELTEKPEPLKIKKIKEEKQEIPKLKPRMP